MIISKTVYTYEADDPAAALRELERQLYSDGFVLRSQSVGLLFCDPEYVDTGVLQHVALSLPFPVAGATTFAQAVNGQTGQMMLSLMVLTADDVYFEVGQCSCATDSLQAALQPEFDRAASRLPEPPSLIFMFPPMQFGVPGNLYIDVMERICPGVPQFGTMAVDDSMTFARAATFQGACHMTDGLSFVLISGSIAPQFIITTISESKGLTYVGEVTRAHSNRIIEINDMSAAKYFERIGLARDGVMDDGVQFLPFKVDLKGRQDYDGVPVYRVVNALDKEGAAFSPGNIDTGSVFRICSIDAQDVLLTTRRLAETINQLENPGAVLMFSCTTRRTCFGADLLKEAQALAETVRPGLPVFMAYSGGEICPTSCEPGAVSNRYHNHSLITCIL